MQTRATAKNSFSSGLIMDFAPDNTQADILTNALNATFLTFNGNEMSLLNDMGNGRVESAFLPEGYIPVGTCEFGDIIYIVSYNPLEGKSLIGCFPSPERNISNKEISDLELSIQSSELAEKGKINSYSVKKIIFGNTNINSGDKFIVSWGDDSYDNQKYISNYGNTSGNTKDPEAYWPKITKVSIVSINDSGKITYIDSNVKWYKNNVKEGDGDFIISDLKFQTDSETDTTFNLDQYRNALQCQYSIFQENTSGKLALLLELETIKGFSCSHKVFLANKSGNINYYDIYLSVSWDTDNYNINPSGILVTNSKVIDNITILKGNNTLYNFNIDQSLWKSPSRVVEFSRLYDLSNPPNKYSDFINKESYYAKVNLIKFKAEAGIGNLLSLGEEIKSDNLLLLYKEDNGYGPYRAPYIYGNDEDNEDIKNKGLYVPFEVEIEKGKFITKTSKGRTMAVLPLAISDDVVVNKYHKSVLKKIGRVSISDSKKEGSLTYTVCPCMPYGPLEYLAVTNTIIIRPESTDTVELKKWRYYVNQKSVTLNYGLDYDLKDDKAVGKVMMEFYDLNGLCATYYLENQESYNGQFTEYLELNLASSNYKMSTLDSNGNKIYHPGQKTTYGEIKDKDDSIKSQYRYINIKENHNNLKEVSYIPLSEVEGPIADSAEVCANDAGILYSGIPYLVKIVVFIGKENVLGKIEMKEDASTETFYRWLWTAPVFNNDYLNDAITDFQDLQIDCTVDFNATLDGSNIKQETFTYYNSNMTIKLDTLGAQVDTINRDDKNGHIIFKGVPKMENTYGGSLELDKKRYNDLVTIETAIHKQRVEAPETRVVLEESREEIKLDVLKPITSNDGYDTSLLGSHLKNILGINNSEEKGDIYVNNYESNQNGFSDYPNIENYKDMFTLEYANDAKLTNTLVDLQYYDSDGQYQIYNGSGYKTSVEYWEAGIPIKFQGIKFNKVLSYSPYISKNGKLLVPLISTENDLDMYGIGIRDLGTDVFGNTGTAYFKYAIYLGLGTEKGHPGHCAKGLLEFNDNGFYQVINGEFTDVEKEDKPIEKTLQDEKLEIKKIFNSTIPFYQLIIGNPFGGTPLGMYILKRSTEKLMDLMSGEGSYSYKVRAVKNNSKSQFTNPEGVISYFDFKNKDNCVPFINGAWIGQAKNEKGEAVFGNPGTTPLFAALLQASKDNNNLFNLFSTLCYVGNDGELYGTQDACIVTTKQSYSNPNMDFNLNESKAKELGVTNYAQALMSLLMQTYRVTEDTQTYLVLKNTAQLEDFTESWRANILVKTDPVSGITYDNYGDSSSSYYIKILPQIVVTGENGLAEAGINLCDYINLTIKSLGLTDKDKQLPKELTLNVNPKIIGQQKCIEFKYDLPYNIGEIVAEYQTREKAETRLLLVANLVEKEVSINSLYNNYKSIYTPIDDSKLYVYSGGTAVTSFTLQHPFKVLSFFKREPNNDSENKKIIGLCTENIKLDINKYSLLEKYLKYDGRLHVDANLITDTTYEVAISIKERRDAEIQKLQTISLFKYAKL